jgi:hypothetical protein
LTCGGRFYAIAKEFLFLPAQCQPGTALRAVDYIRFRLCKKFLGRQAHLKHKPEGRFYLPDEEIMLQSFCCNMIFPAIFKSALFVYMHFINL